MRPYRSTILPFVVAFALTGCGRAKTFDDSLTTRPTATVTATRAGETPTALGRPLRPPLSPALAERETRRRVWNETIVVNAMVASAATTERVSIRTSSSDTNRTVVAAAGDRCGGDLPPCYVKQRESGGDYGAVNPTGCGGYTCGGAWQFDPRTWAGYGGYQYAQDAPPDVQDAKARELWANGAGASHWGVG